MRRFLFLACLSLVPLLVTGCATTPPTEAATGDARKAFVAWVDAYNAQQWSRMVAMVSDRPGFQWVENGHVIYASKDDVVRAYAWLRDNARTASYRPSDTNVTAFSGESAQVWTHFASDVTTMDGKRLARAGEMRLELRREGGAWRIVGVETRDRTATP